MIFKIMWSAIYTTHVMDYLICAKWDLSKSIKDIRLNKLFPRKVYTLYLRQNEETL